jgi:lysophospholipase L1-like esterase
VLVDTPVTQEYIGEHPHQAADYAVYQEALRGLAARTNTELVPGQVWDTSFFADPVHLNEVGARRLAGELADRLLPSSTPRGP